MKISKTVTDKVIDANRKNARKSPGPKNSSFIKHNAYKHGLAAKLIVFDDPTEEAEFNVFMTELAKDLNASGMLQQMLVTEICACWWRLQIAMSLEGEDLRNWQSASRQLLKTLAAHSEGEGVSVLSPESDNDKALEGLLWDCRDVVLRAGSANYQSIGGDVGEANENSIVEVRLTSAWEKVQRYQGAIKRDLYRALEMLNKLQHPHN
jgi:hypothetical protein